MFLTPQVSSCAAMDSCALRWGATTQARAVSGMARMHRAATNGTPGREVWSKTACSSVPSLASSRWKGAVRATLSIRADMEASSAMRV